MSVLQQSEHVVGNTFENIVMMARTGDLMGAQESLRYLTRGTDGTFTLTFQEALRQVSQVRDMFVSEKKPNGRKRRKA